MGCSGPGPGPGSGPADRSSQRRAVPKPIGSTLFRTRSRSRLTVRRTERVSHGESHGRPVFVAISIVSIFAAFVLTAASFQTVDEAAGRAAAQRAMRSASW